MDTSDVNSCLFNIKTAVYSVYTDILLIVHNNISLN